ncbi:MAG: amine oxidase, partial [Verrucomicrobia bacterium]|nr:amine oxidase [Verrucomicrobiota bacterium]
MRSTRRPNAPRPRPLRSVRERIAIVGSGVSGLGCLRFLRAHHDVTVFDRDLR